jgi:hypothetical protein
MNLPLVTELLIMLSNKKQSANNDIKAKILLYQAANVG